MEPSLCIVGCGEYAKKVLQEFPAMTHEFEVFFASRDMEKAKEYCKTYGGVGYFGSYEQAAADPRVGAMYILTPHNLHLENALLAASNSKHILVVKPIARTIEEGEEMIQAAQASGVNLMVAENYRFLPTVDRCKQLVSQGRIGELRMIQIQNEWYDEPKGWRANATLSGGGGFIDGGIHAVDMLMNLGGVPDRVYSTAPRQIFRHAEVEDGLVMVCRLPNGCLGLINHSIGTPVTKYGYWVNVTGTKGQLRFDPHGSEMTLDTLDSQHTERLPEVRSSIQIMLQEFRDSIIEDREPTMSGREGLKDLAVVLAAYESAKRREEVSLVLA